MFHVKNMFVKHYVKFEEGRSRRSAVIDPDSFGTFDVGDLDL